MEQTSFNFGAALSSLLDVFSLALLVWVAFSWLPNLQQNAFYQNLDRFFNYLLQPIRRIIPPLGGRFDLSPMILVFMVSILKSLLRP